MDKLGEIEGLAVFYVHHDVLSTDAERKQLSQRTCRLRAHWSSWTNLHWQQISEHISNHLLMAPFCVRVTGWRHTHRLPYLKAAAVLSFLFQKRCGQLHRLWQPPTNKTSSKRVRAAETLMDPVGNVLINSKRRTNPPSQRPVVRSWTTWCALAGPTCCLSAFNTSKLKLNRLLYLKKSLN